MIFTDLMLSFGVIIAYNHFQHWFLLEIATSYDIERNAAHKGEQRSYNFGISQKRERLLISVLLL